MSQTNGLNPGNPRDGGAERRGLERMAADLDCTVVDAAGIMNEIAEIQNEIDRLPLTSIGPSGLGGPYQSESAAKPDRALPPQEPHICPHCRGLCSEPAHDGGTCLCELCDGRGEVTHPARAARESRLIALLDTFRRDRELMPASLQSAYARWITQVAQKLHEIDPRWCPRCGHACSYEPSHAAEPDTNTPAWPGGWSCNHCSHTSPRS